MTPVNVMDRKPKKGKILLKIIKSLDFTKAVKLIQKDKSFSPDQLGTALIAACQYGHEVLIQTLIRSGADVYCKDILGNTALMICLKSGYPNVVRFLIENKVDVNATNYNDDTALLLSVCSSGSTEITKLLLEQPGIQIFHQNKDRCSALEKALQVRNFEAANLLLDAYIKVKHDETLTTADNHMQGTVNIFVANRGGENADQREHPYKRPRKKQKGETSQPQVEAELRTSGARTVAPMLDWEFHKIFRSMFLQLNNTDSLSDAEITIIKKLLECKVDVNATWFSFSSFSLMCEIDENHEITDLNKLVKKSNFWKATPLKTAAQTGHHELVELLLKHQAKVNEDHFLQSALHLALMNGHINCVKLLLRHGAKLHIIYALVAAIKSQIPSYMEFLCENYQDEVVSILQKFNNLNVFVRAAVTGGSLQILTQIFKVGVDFRDVHLPLAESKNGDVARFLIEKGADVNASNKDSHLHKTPLLDVMMNRKYFPETIEVIRVLLENGASVNDRGHKCRTPLMIAASRRGSTSLQQLLLDHGASLSNKDSKGNTALIHAMKIDLECGFFLVKVAKDRKDVLNAQNNEGLTALMVAAAVGRIDLVRKFLGYGADVNIEDNHGNTVLFHYLSSLSCVPEKKLLLALVSAGIDVNRHNKDGLSPLMVAAKNCLPLALNILVDSGADVNAVSAKDKTKTALSLVPINFSLCTGAALCIETLLDKGADASYVNPHFLPELILTFRDDYIPKLISCGLCPSDIPLPDPETSGINVLSTVSPLCLALLIGNVPLAQYFVDKLFLTKSDVSSLSSNGLRDFLHHKKQQDCVNFLDTITEQPWSLFNLALVAVSSAVGTLPGRKSRVNVLPLPEKMKYKLLYQTDDVKLIIPHDADTVSQIQHRTFWMRKFGDYYRKTKSFQYIPKDLDSDFDLNSLSSSDSDDDFKTKFINMMYSDSTSDSDFDLESGSNYSNSDW